MSSKARIAAFAGVCAVCLAGSAGYLVHAQGRAPKVEAGVVEEKAAEAEGARSGEHVFFRSLAEGQQGLAALAGLPPGGAAPAGRAPVDLECNRVYFAAGSGLCLTENGDLFTPYNIVFLGPDLKPRHRESLAGLISRARVSPDGRYGAATVFVTGHSYAGSGFSTQTTIYEMATGNLLEDLENFEVWKDGDRIEAPDFNFWGVTFTREPGVFYATLGTGGHTYLVKGDLDTTRLEVLRDGVECPSVSPDGKRLAFKHRVDAGPGDVKWVPAVLDLDTLEAHDLAEDRTIDDQIEWLDDATVLYAVREGDRTSTWATPADGTGAPALFLADAESPSVVR